jgi:hypothetical protein
MPYLILANEETAVARSGAGWFEDMRDKKPDKRLWPSVVGNDGRTALVITPRPKPTLDNPPKIARLLVCGNPSSSAKRMPADWRVEIVSDT